MTIGKRLLRLEDLQAERDALPVEQPWWERVPAPVCDYLRAQDPAVAEAFGAHLDAMQSLPGDRDGFAYYQVLTRPWRPGERQFVGPAMTVWDLLFRTDGRLTLGDAQVCVLACGFHNLCDAEPGAVPALAGRRWQEAWAARETAQAAVWGRLAGGPLCAAPHCLCFVRDQGNPCRNPRAPVLAWRARGTTDAATLVALGFGAAEMALLGLDDADSTQTSEEGDDAA